MSRQTEIRQRFAADSDAFKALDADLASLDGKAMTELKAIWTCRIGNPPPLIRSVALLRRLLAWQLQVNAVGSLDAATARELGDIAKSIERDGTYEPKVRRRLSPGVALTREWKGSVHKATVVAEGFQYLGKHYSSLSEVARTITGTRWSGPRFFGLEQKKLRKGATP